MAVPGPQGDGPFTELLMWMHSLPCLCDLNRPAVGTAFQFLNIIIIFCCFARVLCTLHCVGWYGL